jgi:hypothetical protein
LPMKKLFHPPESHRNAGVPSRGTGVQFQDNFGVELRIGR